LIKTSLKDITLSLSSDLKTLVMDIWIVDSLLTMPISYLVTTGMLITHAQKSLVTKLLYTVTAVMEDKSSPSKVIKKNA